MITIAKSSNDYPFAVGYDASNPGAPIVVSEGRGGQELISAALSLDDALQRRFRKYFTESGAEWFLPFIEKMKSSGIASENEITEIIRNRK